MVEPPLNAGGGFAQFHQGVGAIVELVAATALGLACLGRQQRPAAAILLIEIQSRDGALRYLFCKDLVALLVGEEAIEQHQRIGGGQLFAGDKVGGPGGAGALRQDQLEAPLLQLGIGQLADPLGQLFAKGIALLGFLLGGWVELGLLGRGEQQQGIKAQLAEGTGQLPELTAALPVGQQDGETHIVVAIVLGKQHRLFVDLGSFGLPFPVARLPVIEGEWLRDGRCNVARLRDMASQHGQ